MNFLPFITVIDPLNSNSIFAEEQILRRCIRGKKTLYNFEVEFLYALNNETHSDLFCDLCFD